jgi:hypothetical protein
VSKRTTPAKNAPKTGTSLVDNARVQDRHRAIAREALTESRAPAQILKDSQRKTLGK